MPKNPVKLKSGKNNDGKKTQFQYGIPLILLAACLMPFVYGMSSWLYLLVALVLSLVFFVVHAFKLWRQYSDQQARQTFKFSLVHLSVLFAAMLVDHYLF